MALIKNRLLLTSVLILFVCGCYESQFPLSSSDTAGIDERLVKCWLEQTDKKKDSPYRVVICKFNDYEYFIAFSDSPGKEAALARGFTTVINDVSIINLQGIESLASKDRTFLYFKYIITPQGNLRVWMIDKESPLFKNITFANQAELYAFVKKNVRNEALYSAVWDFKPAKGIRLNMSREDEK
jgi:hypothetical protein